jgi:hypothetical protein
MEPLFFLLANAENYSKALILHMHRATRLIIFNTPLL